MQVAGATVFLTGANRGLGRVLAELLLERDVFAPVTESNGGDAIVNMISIPHSAPEEVAAGLLAGSKPATRTSPPCALSRLGA